MAIHSPSVQRRRPAPQTTKSIRQPAANGGMDSRVFIGQGDPNIAIYTYNLLASEFGMKVRSGYSEHCIALESVTSTGVKTILPFESLGDPIHSRLFAATNEGIWDVTTYDTPSLVYTFGATTGNAGIGVYTQYITDAEDSLLFYADEENGLLQYEQATGLWTVPAGITGVTVANVRFIMSHKQRLWLIEKDQADAWYLPLSSISGLAVKFQFGQQFKHGGILSGLYNWTVDGGIGVDDYLVAISSGGDVLPYQGADPEATDDWQIRGVYFVGQVASVQQCAIPVGGDLQILSTYGLVSLSALLTGSALTTSIQENAIGAKMTFLLQADLKTYPIDSGWSLQFLPAQGDMLINSPIRAGDVYLQYVYDLSNNSFGFWRGVPIVGVSEWQSTVYIGTADSRVLVMNADLDEVKITPVNAINGEEIAFSSLFAFLPYDASGAFKRGVSVRPDFMSKRNIAYETKFTYDYEILNFASTVSGQVTRAGRWDVGIWDSTVWGSNTLTSRAQVRGGSGVGRTMAVAINGSGTSDTWFMSYDVMWNNGGML